MRHSIAKLLLALGTLVVLALKTTPVFSKDLQSVIDQYCRRDCVTAVKLIEVIDKTSRRYGINPHVILSIVHIESKYNTKARNGSSVGLSQVLLRYHKRKFKTKDYHDVEDNLSVGMQILRDCLTSTKWNYPRAFRCYNGGGDKNYSDKVHATMSYLKSVDLSYPVDDPLWHFIKNHLQSDDLDKGSSHEMVKRHNKAVRRVNKKDSKQKRRRRYTG